MATVNVGVRVSESVELVPVVVNHVAMLLELGATDVCLVWVKRRSSNYQ